MSDEQAAFNLGLGCGLALGALLCVLVAITINMSWYGDYNKLQTQAVEHHAAEWIPESNGNVTFTWIENAD